MLLTSKNISIMKNNKQFMKNNKQYFFKIILSCLLLHSLTWSDSYSNDFFEPTSTIGGYGELHYNFSKNNGEKSTRKLDFHRFVLFLSHSWTEQLSVEAEVELEHNFVQKNGKGELELEQAYIQYTFLNNQLNFKVGALLAPVSYINSFHEPNLFLSVERPRYTNKIIPSTWFDNGASLTWNINSEVTLIGSVLGGLNLYAVRDQQTNLRSGRQKGYKTNAHSLLYTGKIQWTSSFGLLAGGSISHNQDNRGDVIVNDSIGNKSLSIQVLEGHVKYENYRFFVLIEGALIFLDDSIGQGSNGFYTELGVNLLSKHVSRQLWTGVRVESLNNKIGAQIRETNWLINLSYKPINHITYKADFGKRIVGNEKTTLFNLGAGYSF